MLRRCYESESSAEGRPEEALDGGGDLGELGDGAQEADGGGGGAEDGDELQ